MFRSTLFENKTQIFSCNELTVFSGKIEGFGPSSTTDQLGQLTRITSDFRWLKPVSE